MSAPINQANTPVDTIPLAPDLGNVVGLNSKPYIYVAPSAKKGILEVALPTGTKVHRIMKAQVGERFASLGNIFNALKALPYALTGAVYGLWTITNSAKLALSTVLLGDTSNTSNVAKNAQKCNEWFKKAGRALMTGVVGGVAGFIKPSFGKHINAQFSIDPIQVSSDKITSLEANQIKNGAARAKIALGITKDIKAAKAAEKSDVQANIYRLTAAMFTAKQNVKTTRNTASAANAAVNLARADFITAQVTVSAAQGAVAAAQAVINANGRLAPLAHLMTKTGVAQQAALRNAQAALTAAEANFGVAEANLGVTQDARAQAYDVRDAAKRELSNVKTELTRAESLLPQIVPGFDAKSTMAVNAKKATVKNDEPAKEEVIRAGFFRRVVDLQPII